MNGWGDNMNGWGFAGLIALAIGIIASVTGSFTVGGIFIIVSLVLSIISVIVSTNKVWAIIQIVIGLVCTFIFVSKSIA